MITKVMVVDDSELIHSMYKLMLKKYQGCEMVSAKNGKEGLDMLELHPDVDLILLDINMPVMSGLEFLEIVKDGYSHSHIPIIVVSTEGKEADTRRAVEMGASGYIVKPFKSVHLHEMIASITGKQFAIA